MIDFVAIPYSPWSEKARWALDHHDVQYRERLYTPMLGEPALRARLRQWRGKITVPILHVGTRVIQDSFQIARYAEEIGASATDLFPEEHETEIRRWNDRSETALAAGRALLSQRVLSDPQAKKEALPAMPGVMKSIMTPLASIGVGYLRRKYDYSASLEPQRQAYQQVLETLREALKSGDALLGGGFSYADLCMAVTLQCVRPVTDEFIKLGPATRLAWTDDLLASQFPDLLDWRDRVYEAHRH